MAMTDAEKRELADLRRMVARHQMLLSNISGEGISTRHDSIHVRPLPPLWQLDNQGLTAHVGWNDMPDDTFGTASLAGYRVFANQVWHGASQWLRFTVFSPTGRATLADPQPGPVCVVPAGTGRVVVRGQINLAVEQQYDFVTTASQYLQVVAFARLVNVDEYGNPEEWVGADGEIYGTDNEGIEGVLTAWLPALAGQWYTPTSAGTAVPGVHPTGDLATFTPGDSSRATWQRVTPAEVYLNVGTQEARVCWQIRFRARWDNGPPNDPTLQVFAVHALHCGPHPGVYAGGTLIDYTHVRPASLVGFPDLEPPGAGSGGAGSGLLLTLPRG